MEKIRVYNPRKFAIGVILQNGAERAILPGSFALLSKDDIEYLASIAPALFEDENLLQIEDRTVAVDLGFIDSLEKPVLDADEIRRCLGQRISQVKAWLEGIEEEYLLDAICDVAAEMDLPASKLQLLKERMPEREFLAKE
ncbi:MAG: hypothetical protein J6K55_14195 [Clostridia bacterium]|nr:hypothetical protein [Clostridia bacterium]